MSYIYPALLRHIHQAAAAALRTATHLICTAAPNEDQGDPFLASLGPLLTEGAAQVQWMGYLSTTGVYGNQDGGTVDETCPPAPGSKRAKLRVEAENAWAATGVWRLPVQVKASSLITCCLPSAARSHLPLAGHIRAGAGAVGQGARKRRDPYP